MSKCQKQPKREATSLEIAHIAPAILIERGDIDYEHFFLTFSHGNSRPLIEVSTSQLAVQLAVQLAFSASTGLYK